MNTELLFISDLHLDAHKPLISENFLTFLKTRAVSARVLYILGDLFEAWLGDDDSTHNLKQVFDALRQLSLTTEVFFLHGNRDFLVGDATARKLGIHLLNDPEIIRLGSHRVALMHGDQLCTDDNDYQEFRARVRSAQWQQHFLARPLNERQAIAEQLRAQSQFAMQQKTESIMDVNQQAVLDCFHQLGVDTIIHGHTHRPCIHQDIPAKRRIVLGDWNPEPSYLSWKNGRFDLFDPRVSGQHVSLDNPE